METVIQFKVGDEVYVVYPSAFGDRVSYQQLTTIQSVSPKRGDIKLVDCSATFDSRGQSKSRHDRWTRGPWIELATPELKSMVRERRQRQKALDYLRDFDFKKLTTDQLVTTVDQLRSMTEVK